MESDAWPMRPERILADLRAVHAARRDPLHRRGLEQERHGPAVPDLHAGQRLHAGRLRDDGLRLAGGAGREGGAARQGRRRADRRRRLRPEPGGARHRVRGGHRGHLGDHEQLRVRHHRRPREGALRHDVRARCSRRTASPGRPTTRRSPGPTASTASRSASAAEFKPALEKAIKSKRPVRHRRLHEERAGAHGGPLEHHGHLLAGQEGAPRQHRR